MAGGRREAPLLRPEPAVVRTAGRRPHLMTISICPDYISETFSVGKQHQGIKTILESGLDSSYSRMAAGRSERPRVHGLPAAKQCLVGAPHPAPKAWHGGQTAPVAASCRSRPSQAQGLGLCRRESQHPSQFETRGSCPPSWPVFSRQC